MPLTTIATLALLCSSQNVSAQPNPQVVLYTDKSPVPDLWRSVMRQADARDPDATKAIAKKASLFAMTEANVVYLFDEEALSYQARDAFDAALLAIESALVNGTDLNGTKITELPQLLQDAIRRRVVYHYGSMYAQLETAELVVRIAPGIYTKLKNGNAEIPVAVYFESGDLPVTTVQSGTSGTRDLSPDLGALARTTVQQGVAAHYSYPDLPDIVLKQIARGYEIAAEIAACKSRTTIQLLDRVWPKLVVRRLGATPTPLSSVSWKSLDPLIKHPLSSNVHAIAVRYGLTTPEEISSFLDGAVLTSTMRVLGVSVRFRDSTTGSVQSTTIRIWLDGN